MSDNTATKVGKNIEVFLEGLAGIALLMMMLVTAVDVIGRYFFGLAITGSVELTQITLAVVVFLAFPLVCWREEHVSIDLLDSIFPHRFVWFRQCTINLLCTAALWIMTPTIWALAERALQWGDTTEYLDIPMGYLIGLMAVMTAIAALLTLLRAVLYLLEGLGLVRSGGPLSASKVHDPEDFQANV
ncbi:MAG: TRAP transporter small permease [Spiribacter salinus]|uniref:TRAP transporter small permease protein n=1 Tax=Spiribacter salinus TaxID=1335746 RepID=A0A540VQW0_9GAMM|nr:MAG: TRAP transporter small permease [Spiribacter salinus]